MVWPGNLRKRAAYCLPAVFLGMAAFIFPIAQALGKSSAQVLVIHSYNPELSWTQQQKMGIDDGFQSSQHAITVYHEFLDAKRYPELEHRDAFLSYLRNKYQETDLRLLMVSDDPGLQLILATHDEYFPEMPVVFMGVNHVQKELMDIPWLTGVFETHSLKETILEATRQTHSEQVIILSDSTETGEAHLNRLAKQHSEVNHFPELNVVKDVTPDTIATTIGNYPSTWPVMIIGQLRAGQQSRALLPFEDSAAVLRSQLENPIYTESVMHLGHGAVGGKVLEGRYHAAQAVQLAEQILDGVPISQIEAITTSKNQWIFDATELKRFKITETDLPPDSILINKQPSFYEQYRQLVWYSLSIFILGSLTILALLDAIRRQKQAEIMLESRVAERTNELSETLQELKQTQAQLIQTEKLSSLGQLVGGIAHEFNNPLTFIAGNLETLKDYGQELLNLISLYQQQKQSSDTFSKTALYAQEIDLEYIQEDMPKIFQSVAKGTVRIENIVRSLQSFACANEQGIKPVDLNKNLDNTLLILKSRLGNDIDVVKSYGKLPRVDCDPSAINQVFMQVLLNAIEAVNNLDKGDLHQITIQSHPQEDNWVTISIKDTGSGIPDSIQDKIFDPFFTTKPVGAGAGLGLAVSYQYIQQHHGRLTFQPNVPQGSIFTIQLPITQPI